MKPVCLTVHFAIIFVVQSKKPAHCSNNTLNPLSQLNPKKHDTILAPVRARPGQDCCVLLCMMRVSRGVTLRGAMLTRGCSQLTDRGSFRPRSVAQLFVELCHRCSFSVLMTRLNQDKQNFLGVEQNHDNEQSRVDNNIS